MMKNNGQPSIVNAQLKPYEKYKDSGVEWLGEIPEHWGIKKFKFIATSDKGKLPKKIVTSGDCLPPYLSMEYLRGADVTQYVQDKEAHLVEENEILLLWDGSNSGEFIKSRSGVISSTVAHVSYFGVNNDFAWYLSQVVEKRLRSTTIGMGIPHVNGSELNNCLLTLPEPNEQTAIAEFLDEKTGKIDEAIAIKQKQIELLKERKQILIQNAVTRGLNPHVKLKESGIDWIGQIPEHWKVKRLKYVLEERNKRSKTGEEPLFMVSQIHGLVVRADFHAKAEVALSNIDNKIVYKNDLVFNKLKAHLGVFFKSNMDFQGLVSPDYAVYKSKAYIKDMKLLEILFRHPSYIEQFIIRATGIVEGLIRLYTGDLFDIPVPIAPENEQAEILEFINKKSLNFDKLVDLQQQQIEKLKEYKSTLINSAVTGKIKLV